MAKKVAAKTSVKVLERGFVKLPVLILSRKDFRTTTAKLKKGTSLDLGRVADPTAPRKVAFAKTSGKGPVASPKRRRRHAVCRVYDAEELELVFGIATEYGGMVCVR